MNNGMLNVASLLDLHATMTSNTCILAGVAGLMPTIPWTGLWSTIIPGAATATIRTQYVTAIFDLTRCSVQPSLQCPPSDKRSHTHCRTRRKF